QIVFYEERNFKGRYHECNNNSSDLHTYVSRCNSIKVSGGFWVGNSWRMKIWEKPNFEGESMELSDNMLTFLPRALPNYRGHQFLLERGEYRRHSEWGSRQPGVGSIRRVKN
ncbi:gamma-crystallin M2-like, partial [Nothobranchius furzeri]